MEREDKPEVCQCGHLRKQHSCLATDENTPDGFCACSEFSPALTQPDLTLRDLFAAFALVGMASHPLGIVIDSRRAYLYADAMLEARSARKPEAKDAH